jgi:hypothetical protein
MKKLSILVILIGFSFSLALFGCQQNGTMKADVEKLKETQEKTAKDLEEIKKLLQAKSPPKPAEFKEAVIDVGDEPSMGEKLAKVTLIEYLDFQ